MFSERFGSGEHLDEDGFLLVDEHSCDLASHLLVIYDSINDGEDELSNKIREVVSSSLFVELFESVSI